MTCLLRRLRCRQSAQLTTDSEKVCDHPRCVSGASAIVSVRKPTSVNDASCDSIHPTENLGEKGSLTTCPLIPGFPVEDDCVVIWNFPISISQTRLGDRVYASSACALISVAMAENIFRKGIHLPLWNGVQVVDIDAARFPSKQNNNNRRFATKQNILPSRLCASMINAIIDGNHRVDLVSKPPVCELFNIPKAIRLSGSNFAEVAFVTTKLRHGDAFSLLYSNLKSAIEHTFVAQWKQMFFAVMFVERCVLIVYEREMDSIAILDSHTHNKVGALVAVSNRNHLHRFCAYVIRRFFADTAGLKPYEMKFEMSLLSFTGALGDLDSPIDTECVSRAPQLQFRHKCPNVFEDGEYWLKRLQWKPQNLEPIKKNRILDILRKL